VDQFDSDFDRKAQMALLRETKLTAKKKDDGRILVTVDGKTTEGIKSFLFGTNGLIEEMTMSRDLGMGTKQDLTMHMQYRKEGEKHLQTGESFEVEMGGMGKLSVERVTTYEQVKGFYLRKKLESKTSMGGKSMGSSTLEFTDWKLNEEVK